MAKNGHEMALELVSRADNPYKKSSAVNGVGSMSLCGPNRRKSRRFVVRAPQTGHRAPPGPDPGMTRVTSVPGSWVHPAPRVSPTPQIQLVARCNHDPGVAGTWVSLKTRDSRDSGVPTSRVYPGSGVRPQPGCIRDPGLPGSRVYIPGSMGIPGTRVHTRGARVHPRPWVYPGYR